MAAKQVVKMEMFYSGVWNDISGDVFAEEAITTIWGQGDEGAGFRPGNLKFTLNNSTDKYRPTNPMSPLYGLVGRNTPVRFSVDGVIQMQGEASFSPERSADFRVSPARGRSMMDLDVNGVTRRISQWTDLLGSPMTRYDSRIANLLGHYPMEDGRTTAVPTNLIAGAPPALVLLTNFESQDYPPGSDPLMETTLGGGFRLNFAPGTSATTGFQVSWVMRNGSIPGTLWEMMNVKATNGMAYILTLNNGTGLQLTAGFDDGSGFLMNVNSVVSSINFLQWNLCRLKVEYSAGTTTVTFSYNTLGSPFLATISGTFSGQPGLLSSCGASNSGWTHGHFIATDGAAQDLLSTNRLSAFQGYSGETAAARFTRVAGTEEGFTTSVIGTSAASWPMGPQRNDTLYGVLQEIAQTEDGLIYDKKSGVGLDFRLRSNLYNQTPLALTFPGHLSAPFTEVIDDLNTHNDVTMQNNQGAQYEKILSTGPMSVLAAPNGVGYNRQTIDVNVSDEFNALPLLAGWWLNKGTLPNSRYNQINIDLVANPGLAASVNALKPGDYVTVTGYDFNVIPLMVLGIQQKIGTHSRLVTLNTVPGDLFQTGKYDDTTMRYDSASTTLAATQTTTSTSWNIATSNVQETWSSTGVPYDVFATGERVRVTVCTAPAGTGPYTQTMTVTRSINGVVKTHASGESVRIATPGRYAL